MRARPGTIHTNSIRASPSRAMSFSPGSPPDPRGTTSGRPLRLFPSAALPHPPLRLFFSYSGGSRGAAEGKGRSGRGCGRARGHRCARGRRPTRLFRIIDPARLAADANGPAGGAARRLGKATGAHLPASAPRPSSSSHSSTNPDEKGSMNLPLAPRIALGIIAGPTIAVVAMPMFPAVAVIPLVGGLMMACQRPRAHLPQETRPATG